MKKIVFFIGFAVLLGLGCARIRVEAPKEPIKMDISMRLDIYQHVEKDINAIEDMVSGPKKETKPSDKQSFLDSFNSCAYAQEGISPQAEQAALRRKDRRDTLLSLEEKAVIGENKSGLVEIRKPDAANKDADSLVEAENSDRMIIYNYIAEKNNTPLEEVQRMYANRLQNDAPSGTPIEVLNTSGGTSEWKVK